MKLIAMALSTVLAVGCSSTDRRPFTNLSTTPANSRLGSVIYVSDKLCPNDPDSKAKEFAFLAPVIAVGVSMAVTYLVEAVNKSIEEYKKGLTGSFTASGPSGHKANAIKCIIIARGQLGSRDRDNTTNDNDVLRTIYPGLGFGDYPSFYLELKVAKQGEKALQLTPLYLSYAASIARNEGSGKKNVSMVLAFSDTSQKKADEINEDKAFAIFRHDFGRLEVGKRYHKSLLTGTSASSSITTESLNKEGFNVSTLVTDSEDPGIALQVLSETFASKKGDLQKALEDTIKKAIDDKIAENKDPK